MRLYEINQTYMRIADALIENEGELTPELEDEIRITDENFEAKMVAYAQIIATYKGEVESVKSEVERLAKLKRVRENAIKQLTQSMSDAMKISGRDKVEAGTFRIGFRKSTAVTILDENAIPDNFKSTQISIDKIAIKNALKIGELVSGAELTENKNIQIR